MSATPHEELLIPTGGPYLATHSVGCLTRAAVEALQSTYLDPWRHEGADAWEQWLEGIAQFRQALATLLGGHANEYCPQQNLSAGLSSLLGALPAPHSPRNVWIAAEDSFPSLGFVLQRAQVLGYRLRLIPRRQSPADLETWVDALTPDVCGVLVTHVFSNTGVVAPVHGVVENARARGVWSVVDVAQSAGILPMSVVDLNADVVLGSCVKWLCGGPGAGFLRVGDEVAQRLEPTHVGWFSHADPFEMDIRSFRFATGARRFWGGTPSVAPYVVSAASMRLLAGIGVDTILAHTRRLQTIFRESLPSRWRDRVALTTIGGTLCISCGDALPDVRRGLRNLRARFDERGDIVRLSFHLCNTAEEARAVGGVFS